MLRTLTSIALLVAPFLQAPPDPQPPPPQAAPKAAPGARTKTGGLIREPTKKKHVAPAWPKNALRAGLEGRVVLECVIGVDGRVTDVKTVSGPRSLVEAASAAVRDWVYEVTTLNGEPTTVIMTVTVNFKLDRPPTLQDAAASVRDSDPEIRLTAIGWLGGYRPVSGRQKKALKSALRDASEQVRVAAEKALAALEAQ